MFDSPLPGSPGAPFGAARDPGSSFVDLLRQVAPHELPGAGSANAAAPGATGVGAIDVTHGTTVLAIRYTDGVVMAGDRRATAGYTIANRRMDKVFPADEFSGVAIAGAAGPAMEMVRLFQVQLEHYEKIEGALLSLEGKANQLGQMVRGNLQAAMAGFVVVPLFAGYDAKRGRGRVFSYDATGGKYEEADYQTNGSGGVHARNWIKAFWREGMQREEVVDLALRALFAAADEDAATGGPDLIRHIYPLVAVISADGYDLVDDTVVAERAAALLGGREEGEGL
jgi:proteasome beta subunit